MMKRGFEMMRKENRRCREINTDQRR